MTERVLFFSPHAGIWVHAFPEALVADAVRKTGGEVVYVTCGGALSSFCVTMAAHGLRPSSDAAKKAAICRMCRRNRDLVRFSFGFRSYDFESKLTAADEARIQGLVGEARREDVASFVVDGVRVGQAALYEYLIENKRAGGVLDEAEWSEFRPRLVNVLRSLVAARKIIEAENPTRIAAYNTLYSVNAMWRALADERGIPMFVLHAGPSLARRLQTMLIARDSTTRATYRLVDAWPAHANVPCTPAELAAVTDHFCEVLAGTNVFSYSAPKSHGEWRARFGIRSDQQLLVATMSSYDEYVAARAVGEQPDESGLLFATQIEWIRALVEWIRDKPDRFLLVRVHPREFPNKREGVKSEHAQMLERALVGLPDNVRVNWPADALSLYDIAEHADVFLNAWSSAGKEMTLLGRPVVVYCPSLLMYAPAINYVGETNETYFAAIEAALRDGWTFENIRRAYRWCAVEYVRAIADISDGFDYSEARAITTLGRARNLLFAVPTVRQAYDLMKRPKQLREQTRIAETILSGAGSLLSHDRSPASEDAETVALRHELRRLVAALYGDLTGTPRPGSLRAHLTAAAGPPGNR